MKIVSWLLDETLQATCLITLLNLLSVSSITRKGTVGTFVHEWQSSYLMYSEFECRRLGIMSLLCLPPPPNQCLTAFCKNAASTDGPSTLICRKEWRHRRKFLKLAPTIHAFRPKNIICLFLVCCEAMGIQGIYFLVLFFFHGDNGR